MKRTILIAGLIFTIAVLAVPSQPQPASNATVAVAFTGLEGTLLTALGQTGRTLDAAVYDLTLDSVFTTLQALNAKGVTARILLSTEGGGGQKERELCRKLDALDRIEVRRCSNMHHKFAILDGAITLTGSMNWTPTSTEQEANNLVTIRSAEIAAKYKAEFERLWRSAKSGCQ